MMSQRGCPEWCVHTKHEALCYSHKYSHWRVFGDDQIFTRNSQQEEEESTASSWSGVTVDFHFSPTSATILIIFLSFLCSMKHFFFTFVGLPPFVFLFGVNTSLRLHLRLACFQFLIFSNETLKLKAVFTPALHHFWTFLDITRDRCIRMC